MSELTLDHHGKLRNLGRPFRLSKRSLGSAHPQSHPTRFESRTYHSRAETLKTVG